jgi:hypothetical protein
LASGVGATKGFRELRATSAEIPDAVKDAIWRNLTDCSVGFVRVEEGSGGHDAVLLGSGTLVAIGDTRAVLTAHHVVSELPRTGRLGLILSQGPQDETADTQGLEYREIARGTVDSEGPDLAAVVLSPLIANSIAAKKTFYNLDLRRDQLLQTPPDLSVGLWVVHGFIDERTRVDQGATGNPMIKGFYSLSGATVPEPPVSAGDHDYFLCPVSHGGWSAAPKSFEGMSGGGLWQIPICRDRQGNVTHQTPLLSGVVFYQKLTERMSSAVKCHGRQSVYRVAYERLRSNSS